MASSRRLRRRLLRDNLFRDPANYLLSLGKVVLINFFTTWCIPCLRELPRMDKLYQTCKDKGFAALGVSLDVQFEPFSPSWVLL